MRRFKIVSIVKALLLVFAVGSVAQLAIPDSAEARAGRGRSSGRSFGSRPSSSNYNSQPRSQPSQPMGMNNNRGGFMRGLAGGIAGGFLGSMLFGSLGHASGMGGGGHGGMGLLEILLLAGLAYCGFRWWKNRQQQALAMGSGNMARSYGSSLGEPDNNSSLGYRPALEAVAIDPEEASDIFFKVQAAWTRRDLASIRHLVGREMQDTLERDLQELKQAQRINRLENISVRRTEVRESWQEDGSSYATVRLTANLLDYVVDEKSGQVLEGSDTLPEKFEEDWTFAKAGSQGWQLVGIQQILN